MKIYGFHDNDVFRVRFCFYFIVIQERRRATEDFVAVWAETGDFRDTHTGMSSSGTMDHPQLPFPSASRNRTRDRKGNKFFLFI